MSSPANGTGLFILTGAPPAIAGEPAVAQGAYGANGNVELIAPDPEDGL